MGFLLNPNIHHHVIIFNYQISGFRRCGSHFIRLHLTQRKKIYFRKTVKEHSNKVNSESGFLKLLYVVLVCQRIK